MIETIIREYLSNILGVPVLLEQPKEIPNEWVLMELINEGITNKISAVTFDFTSQADTQYNAKFLSDKVRDALDSMNLDVVSSAKFGGARYRMESRKYKHTITYNFFYYREETNNG